MEYAIYIHGGNAVETTNALCAGNCTARAPYGIVELILDDVACYSGMATESEVSSAIDGLPALGYANCAYEVMRYDEIPGTFYLQEIVVSTGTMA